MKKELIWLSDIHIDIGEYSFTYEHEKIRRRRPRGVLITGDISNARRLGQDLSKLSIFFDAPVYFTLGNHDYYGGSFAGVQDLVKNLCSQTPNLIYLDQHAPIWLSRRTALIGCPGWGDGRAGLGAKSDLFVNDRVHIRDFCDLEREAYLKALRELGQASATAFLLAAPPVLERADHLIVATHVPPFMPSFIRRREHSKCAPFYVNMALGRAILRVARKFPNRKISVYCGHTHRRSLYSPLPNVTVYVAEAQYEVFSVAGKIQIDGGSKPGI